MAHTAFNIRFDRMLTDAEINAYLAEVARGGAKVTVDVVPPKRTVKIVQDKSPLNPRDENNVGVMFCAHRRYTLGDSGAEDPRQMLDDAFALRLPIYMYDHSGLAFSHTPFSCQWDSGQLGEHYITVDAANENWPGWSSDKLMEAMKQCLANELKTYGHYVSGDVWGYIIVDEEGDEYDSGWNFYGDDLAETGILDCVPADLHDAARTAWENRFE